MALVLGSLLGAGCVFERSPLWSPQAGAEAHVAAGAGTGGAVQSQRADAGLASSTVTGRASAGQSSQPSAAGAGGGGGGGGTQMPPPQPPATQCHNVFCPLADGSTKACCTTQGDVDQRRARQPELCGVELSEPRASSSIGSGCWQRDQLGIVDPGCVAVGPEPGCCADDGQCGSSNSEQHLGCRHAPGSEVRACGGATPPSNACDSTGGYGLRVTVDVAWDGRDEGLAALTDDGRGPMQIYLLANVQQADPNTQRVTASGRVCGVTLPPFYSSTLCESYQPIFPSALWESASLPNLTFDGHYECGPQGCVLSLGPVTYVFGIRLDNPEAAWPSADETPMHCMGKANGKCFPDDDADGEPGVGIVLQTTGSVPGLWQDPASACREGYAYRAAPLSASPAVIFGGARRSDRMMVGIRARVGASLRFNDDCKAGVGSAVAQYVNSRAAGCLVEPGTFDFVQPNAKPAGANEACTPDEVSFMDHSMPQYRVLGVGEAPATSSWMGGRRDMSPSQGPTVQVVRFDSGATPITCEQVRSARY